MNAQYDFVSGGSAHLFSTILIRFSNLLISLWRNLISLSEMLYLSKKKSHFNSIFLIPEMPDVTIAAHTDIGH